MDISGLDIQKYCHNLESVKVIFFSKWSEIILDAPRIHFMHYLFSNNKNKKPYPKY